MNDARETEGATGVADPSTDAAAVASSNGGSAEQPTVAPSNPLDQTTATTAPDEQTTEVVKSEAAAPAEEQARTEDAPASDTPSDEPPAETATSEEGGVSEEETPSDEVAEVEPIASQAITLERATSVPFDDPDGKLLRTAYALQKERGIPAVDVESKLAEMAAREINTNARMDMLASLVGRLVVHEKSKTNMQEAIGDVAIGDELERFAKEGIEMPGLVALCNRVVLTVRSMAR